MAIWEMDQIKSQQNTMFTVDVEIFKNNTDMVYGEMAEVSLTNFDISINTWFLRPTNQAQEESEKIKRIQSGLILIIRK